jgi:hypothetical protein
MHKWRLLLKLTMAILPAIAAAQTPQLFYEWTFDRPDITEHPAGKLSSSSVGDPGVNPVDNPFGNPFDVKAEALFTHKVTGTRVVQPLFFNGNHEWKLRFRHELAGHWIFRVISNHGELNGRTGEVTIVRHLQPEPKDRHNQPPYLFLPETERGHVVAHGDQWGFSNGEVFVPQYAMAGGPQYYYGQTQRLAGDIQRLIKGHGFNGFHVAVYCRWFNIDSPGCADTRSSNPDVRTFIALEDVIMQVYEAGGTVHLWMYGDDSHKENPAFLAVDGGLNGVADRRLQDYIAARLGPIPGWTMGYGYDLFEWASPNEIQSWHAYLSEKMAANPHLLGARSGKNSLDQRFEGADYASYEQHRPDYATYVDTISRRPGKPSFSEDRFRVRTGYKIDDKDYSLEMTRRGLYHSTMAGGVGNIWGYLQGENVEANQGLRSSGDYPNRHEINIYAQFFSNRFKPDMQRCNHHTSDDASCLQTPDRDLFIIYREKTASISYRHLPKGQYRVVSVDTRGQVYIEKETGIIQGSGQLSLDRKSDWVVALTRVSPN